MILKYLILVFLLILLILSQIKCIDIQLSFEKKNNSDSVYPVVMKIKDNSIEEKNIPTNNNIHLICFFECAFLGQINEHTKTIVDNILFSFKNNDKLSIVLYTEDTNNIYRYLFSKVTNDYKKLNISVNFYKKEENEIIPLQTYNNNENNETEVYLINTFFFFTETNQDNEDNQFIGTLEYLKEFFSIQEDDYSLYHFSFNCKFYPKNFAQILYSRKGVYFPFDGTIDNNDKDLKNFINESIVNTIKDIRNLKYKIHEINITSKYPIKRYYGKNYTNNTSTIDGEIYYIYTFPKYHFISGKEYSYVFEIDLKEIKYGERILYAKTNYSDLNGEFYNISSTSLKFFNAINYFNYKKEEFCRVKLMEAIEESLIINSYNNLNQIINSINSYCEEYCMNLNIETDKIKAFFYLSKILSKLFRKLKYP